MDAAKLPGVLRGLCDEVLDKFKAASPRPVELFDDANVCHARYHPAS